MQDQHKSQSQYLPETHKIILSLQQWWMQGNYNQTKQVVLHSHPEGEWIVYLSYTHTMPTNFSDPCKSRTGKGILQAYTTCDDYFKERGLNPKINWLDNEAFNYLKKNNRNQGLEVQLVPSVVHRRIAVEIDIKRGKTTSLQDFAAQIHIHQCIYFFS